MRPRQATGRPGTAVIPPDWETAHRDVQSRAHRGIVSLRRPGTEQQWSDTEEQMVQVPLDPYATQVQARVRSMDRGNRVVVARDPETTADFLVATDIALGVRVGDRVDLIEVDPALDGHTLVVRMVSGGTEAWSRNLYCTWTD